MNERVKNYFKNFGLPKSVLKSISDQVMTTVGDDAEDDAIAEECKKFDALAKSFQSSVDQRVTAALKNRKADTREEDESDTDDTPTPNDEIGQLTAMIKGLTKQVASLQSEKINETLTEKATAKLKEIKMTDSEIRGVLHGRTFDSVDAVESFVDAQAEIHAETLKDRKAQALGGGDQPPISGDTEGDLAAFKQNVAAFKKELMPDKETA